MSCLLLDADTLIRRPLDELVQLVYRKAGHRRNDRSHQPSCATASKRPADWTELFSLFGLGKPRLDFEHTGWGYYFTDPRLRYCPAYFNYGVIAAPSRMISEIAPVSEDYLRQLREQVGSYFDAQLALTLAIAKLSSPVYALPLRYNMPNHPFLEALHAVGGRARGHPPLAGGSSFSPRRDIRVSGQPGGLPGAHRPAAGQRPGARRDPGDLPHTLRRGEPRRDSGLTDSQGATGMTATPSRLVPITRPHLPELEDFTSIVEELFETRMLSNFSKYSRLLEERAATALDHPAPLCVSSCDIGLTLAWKALQCPPGEVIVPSFTFCSTVNALRWNGLEPVFADVDPETYCIDVDDARRQITPRTVGIAAVHVFGLPAAIEPLQQLAAEHGLQSDLRRRPRSGRPSRRTALGRLWRRQRVQPERHQAGDGRRGRPGHLPRPGGCRAIQLPARLRLQGGLQLPSYRSERETLGAERRPGLAVAGPARGSLEPPAGPGRALSPGPGVVSLTSAGRRYHRAAFTATRTSPSSSPPPQHRAAAETALRAAGVMTKRYFFPVHRMEAYREHALRRFPVTEDLYDRLLCIPLYTISKMSRSTSIAATIIESVRKVASGRNAA